MIRLAFVISIVLAVFVVAEPLPLCIADIVIRQSGRKASSNADTLVTLGKGQSATMTIKVYNRGKVPGLALVMKPEGVEVTNGGTVRNISLASSTSGTREVTVQGKDIGNNCQFGSRLLRVEARPQGEPEGRICGEAVARFSCESGDGVVFSSQTQEVAVQPQAMRRDTAWKSMPPSSSPSVKVARRDTIQGTIVPRP